MKHILNLASYFQPVFVRFSIAKPQNRVTIFTILLNQNEQIRPLDLSAISATCFMHVPKDFRFVPEKIHSRLFMSPPGCFCNKRRIDAIPGGSIHPGWLIPGMAGNPVFRRKIQ